MIRRIRFRARFCVCVCVLFPKQMQQTKLDHKSLDCTLQSQGYLKMTANKFRQIVEIIVELIGGCNQESLLKVEIQTPHAVAIFKIIPRVCVFVAHNLLFTKDHDDEEEARKKN